jgi:hypothetical protein
VALFRQIWIFVDKITVGTLPHFQISKYPKKYLPRTNTLAYFVFSEEGKKFFLTLTQVVVVVVTILILLAVAIFILYKTKRR